MKATIISAVTGVIAGTISNFYEFTYSMAIGIVCAFAALFIYKEVELHHNRNKLTKQLKRSKQKTLNFDTNK